MLVRDATARDFPAMLALNEAWVHFLSPMNAERLELLHRASAYHRVVDDDGSIVGFLLAFRDGATYDSPNFAWFSERYPSFVYVDRVVVAGDAQGKGVGKLLYDDVFAYARRAGVPLVAAEFYTTPFNAVSARFHERYGFTEVGAQSIPPDKHVSLQISRLV